MGESKKTRTLLHLFTAYVHDFKLKSIQNQAKMIDKFIGQYSSYFWIKLDLIKSLTMNSVRSLNIVELDLLLWLRFDLVALQYFRFSTQSKSRQKIKLNYIAQTQKVRGQILDKIDFDPKTLRIL